MRSRSVQRTLPWILTIICLAAVLILAAMQFLPKLDPFGVEKSTRNSQIIESVSRQEQVALVSLGIQGIQEEASKGTLPFLNQVVPWSERATFAQYSFKAKLGVDGEDVRIEETGEDSFLVTIPEFIFIGHDDEDFRLVTENNGALSWLTPEIDQFEMVNTILNDEAKDEYIASNEELLKDQARDFYGSIITSVDPDVKVEFSFAS
jgi:hypothetical protein